jgi:UDP-N-acetylmuramyl pentapeptide phosphotransferase/UDP-N-acetylglucosamine-1-phosphate transferase
MNTELVAYYLPITLLPFMLALGATWWMVRPGNKLASIDKPNHRSMHSRATPRGGGIVIVGILLGYEATTLFAGSSWFPSTSATIGLILVAAISYLDDRGEISASMRILVHLLAALCLVAPVGASFGVSGLMVISCVWCINLYNFMDGIDGLATCMAMVGSAAIGLLMANSGNITALAACHVMFCTCAGFLVFNLPPAKIFLGDVGSASMGYVMSMAVVFALDSSVQAQDPRELMAVLLVFSPFLADATFTVLRRAVTGEKFWLAHRSHVYQRLALRIGATNTLLIYIALMVVCSFSAAWLLYN